MGSNPEGKEGRFWGKCKKKTRHMFRRQDERAEDSVSGCLCLREKEGVSEGKRCQAPNYLGWLKVAVLKVAVYMNHY